jgi:hypothetical protein
MGYFPTNWGSPVSIELPTSQFMQKSIPSQKYDSFDANVTYPLHNRGYGATQHTKYVLSKCLLQPLLQPCAQITEWHARPYRQVQGWNLDGGRQPRFVMCFLCETVTTHPFNTNPISATYSSLVRFKDVQRLHPVGNGRRYEWQHVRLSIPLAPPRRSYHL